MGKLTDNQRLWKQGRQNLLLRIKQLQKQGVNIDESFIPPKPEYISKKHLNILNNALKQVDLIEKQIINNQSLENKITRKQKEDFAVKKYQSNVEKIGYKKNNLPPNMAQLTMNWLESNLDKANTKSAALINEFISKLIEEYGYLTVTRMIYDLGRKGITLNQEVIYDSDGKKASEYISQVTEFIKDTDVYSDLEDFVHTLFDEYDTANWVDDSED